MSAIAFLNVELTNLVSEARRRSPEIKHAAERSLTILKSLSREEESHCLKELANNPDFVTPFLLSCSSRNAKFSTIAIPSIQKLIHSNALPISKIDLLLDALTEATHLAVDIQLKVLQILPTFFQIYGEFINDKLVAKLLLICSMLQTPSKISMVINTASATEQQIVLSLFDKVIDEDKGDVITEVKVTVDDEQMLEVSRNAYDTYRVFSDLCSLIERQKPEFLPINFLSDSFGFELLENVLTNYQTLFVSHVELGFLLRTRLTPLLLRTFSNNKQFSIVVRGARIILLLLKSQVPILEIEAEVILSLLTHAITSESRLPLWKKVLSLEIFSSVFVDFNLTKRIFLIYDFTEEKKKVITEFFTVCSDLLKEIWAKTLLKTNEIVSIPSADLSLTAANSTPRVRYMDTLDKAEAPPPPPTYTLFLILTCTNNLCEGIGQDVLKRSKTESNTFVFLTESEGSTSDISELKGLIKNNAMSLVTIGTEFLYSSIGNDVFHLLIRSLQRLCHAAGVLGLTNERDSLLLLFSIASVSNTVKGGDVTQSSVTETIAGTVSGALNAISSSHDTSLTKRTTKPPQRYLNARHVICFRALTSLAISLGPILKHSWRFILITFQWFDYFVNGPSAYLSVRDVPPKPDLSNVDLKLIDSSLSKFIESTKGYESHEYQAFIQEIVFLGKDAILNSGASEEPIAEDEFVICAYNRDFFLHRTDILSKANANRYLQASNEEWKLLSSFLSDIIINNNAPPDLRVIACSAFNSCISDIANAGFTQDGGSTDISGLERQLFQSFAEVVDRILFTQNTEYLSSTESDIIHGTLKTLYELLDQYGAKFSVSWEMIIHIIDSPFAYFEKAKNIQSQKLLLKSSFEILQLVLNDFLQSLPLSSTKDVVDVLENFCSQKFDLNISFSAVSYYWLLSDYYRGITVNQKEEEFVVETNEDLPTLISTTDSVHIKVHCLWLYALGSLVGVSNDARPDMRIGAIQTFFRIVDSHGSFLNWVITFKIVVQKMLDAEVIKVPSGDVDGMKAFVESNCIILRGVTDIYCRFLLQLESTGYLRAVLTFFNKYIMLEVPQLSEVTYKSFRNVCDLAQDSSHSSVMFPLLFEFWSSQPVKYVSSDINLTQENLVELMECFGKLNRMHSLSRTQTEQSLSIFTNAIRFPFLPRFTSDLKSPTNLQTSVIDSLRLLDSLDNNDLVFSQLASVILLPFHTRSRILKKLPQLHKNDIPSFIAVSMQGMELLESRLRDLDDLKPLIENNGISKILKALMETVSYTAEDPEHFVKLVEAGIWKRSISLITLLAQRVAPSLVEGENDSQIWSLIVETFTMNLPTNNVNSDDFNLETHKDLRDVVLKHLCQPTLTPEIIDHIVSSILDASLLYKNNDLEEFLFQTCESAVEITDALLQLKVEDCSTAPLEVFPQTSFRLLCLSDLFDFCRVGGPQKLISASVPYLLCRIVMIIKRFLGSQRLLNRAPVKVIQQDELRLCLGQLLALLKAINGCDCEGYKSLLKLFPLMLENSQYIGKLTGSNSLLTGITSELYKLSSR